VREAGWEAELAGLGVGLELDLTADGAPANALVVLDLERWRGAPDEEIGRAAGLVAGALPITVGVLRGPLTPGLAPLAAAATLTLADGPAPAVGPATAGLGSHIVAVGDIEGPGPGPVPTDLEAAVNRLRDAVSRSPRAAIACGQLVRQTAVLGTGEGLAAEATAYSLLLGGPEFARWLRERDRDRGPAGCARRSSLRNPCWSRGTTAGCRSCSTSPNDGTRSAP
jgi:hypothetical protein